MTGNTQRNFWNKCKASKACTIWKLVLSRESCSFEYIGNKSLVATFAALRSQEATLEARRNYKARAPPVKLINRARKRKASEKWYVMTAAKK
jgi:hypothetical protein